MKLNYKVLEKLVAHANMVSFNEINAVLVSEEDEKLNKCILSISYGKDNRRIVSQWAASEDATMKQLKDVAAADMINTLFSNGLFALSR